MYLYRLQPNLSSHFELLVPYELIFSFDELLPLMYGSWIEFTEHFSSTAAK